MSQRNPRIAVIGVGGVGGYFGGLLAHHGLDVTFVARGAHAAALQSKGLSLKTVDGDFSVSSLQIVEQITELKEPELILVTTKTYHLEEVARALAEVVVDRSIVITTQNGIAADQVMQQYLPDTAVFPGIAYIISTKTAPGLIEQTAGPRTLLFGDRTKQTNTRLPEVAELMQQAGIRASCVENIEFELWKKFLWITTFAGMTALCRSPIGPIVNDPDVFELYVRCLDEAIAVAEAEGVAVSQELRAAIIEKSEQYRTIGTDAKSSLLVDIEQWRQTEIEALHGELIRRAEKHNLPVPTQKAIYLALRTASLVYLNQ